MLKLVWEKCNWLWKTKQVSGFLIHFNRPRVEVLLEVCGLMTTCVVETVYM